MAAPNTSNLQLNADAKLSQSFSQQHKKINPTSVKSINLKNVKEIKIKEEVKKPSIKASNSTEVVQIPIGCKAKNGYANSNATSPENQLLSSTINLLNSNNQAEKTAIPTNTIINNLVSLGLSLSKSKNLNHDNISKSKISKVKPIINLAQTCQITNAKSQIQLIKKDFNADLKESKLSLVKDIQKLNLNTTKKGSSPKVMVLEQPSISSSSLMNTNLIRKEKETKVKSSINMNSNMNINESSVFSTINDSSKKSPILPDTNPMFTKKFAFKSQSQNDNIRESVNSQVYCAIQPKQIATSLSKNNSGAKDSINQLSSNSNTPYSMNGYDNLPQPRIPSNPRSNNTSVHESSSFIASSNVGEKIGSPALGITASFNNPTKHPEKNLKHLVKLVNFDLGVSSTAKRIQEKTRNIGITGQSIQVVKSNTQGDQTLKRQNTQKIPEVKLIDSDLSIGRKSEKVAESKQNLSNLNQSTQPISIIQNIHHNNIINITLNDDKQNNKHLNMTTSQGFMKSKDIISQSNFISQVLSSNKPKKVSEENAQIAQMKGQNPKLDASSRNQQSLAKQYGTEDNVGQNRKKNETKLQSIIDRINQVNQKYEIINEDSKKAINNNSISEIILSSFTNGKDISRDRNTKGVQPSKNSETDSLLSFESVFDGK